MVAAFLSNDVCSAPLALWKIDQITFLQCRRVDAARVPLFIKLFQDVLHRFVAERDAVVKTKVPVDGLRLQRQPVLSKETKHDLAALFTGHILYVGQVVHNTVEAVGFNTVGQFIYWLAHELAK